MTPSSVSSRKLSAGGPVSALTTARQFVGAGMKLLTDIEARPVLPIGGREERGRRPLTENRPAAKTASPAGL